MDLGGSEARELAVEYYKRLYSLDDVEQMVDQLPQEGFPSLEVAEIRELNKPFVGSEVVMAVKAMGKFNAPGPDGYQPVFYQDCWEVVGDSVLRFVLDSSSQEYYPLIQIMLY